MFMLILQVQPKFLSCLSVSCFNIAAEVQGFNINASQLVMLSQSGCSVSDMKRMSRIIMQKLNPISDSPSNILNMLQIYMDFFRAIAVQLKIEVLLDRMLKVFCCNFY